MLQTESEFRRPSRGGASSGLDRRTVLKAILGAALAPTLAGCLPASGTAGPASRVSVALGADPASLDPLQQTGLVEASVYGNLFDGLLTLGDDGSIQPGLAESYRALDDRRWEFKLRPGVTFHNGEAFDSSSVRATVERMLDPAANWPVRAQLGTIERVETPDAGTAIIVTRQSFAPLLAELTGLMMLPPRALADAGPDGFARQPIGTGPFRFVEWRPSDYLLLEANAGHWRGSPRFKQLQFRPVPDSASRLAGLRAGQVDLITNLPAVQAATLQQGPRMAERPGIQTLYVRLHARKPPLDDVRVRQALALAVNVDQLIATAYGGRARRVNGPYPPEVFGYDDSAAPLPYDPAQARALLKEAGLAGGFSLIFETPRGRYPGDEQVPQILAGYWGEVGARVEIRVVEWGAYLAKLMAGQGEHLFLLAGTNRTFDPHFTIARLYTNASPFGLHYYGNARLDDLAAEAAATLDPAGRRARYARILTTLRDDVPAIWLAQLNDLYGVGARLAWTPRADSLLWMYPAQLGA